MGIVYKTTYIPWIDNTDGKPWMYIGSTSKTGLNYEKYFGSVRSKRWKAWWVNELKTNPQNFIKEILEQTCDDDHCALIELEQHYQIINDAIKSEKFFNNSYATKGIFGRNVSGENNPAYGRTNELHPFFGKKRPEHAVIMTGENNPAKRQEHKDNHHTKTDKFKSEQAERWKTNNPMHNPETVEKVRLAASGPRPNARKPKNKTPCNYCGLLCAPHMLNRYHNENCKRKNVNE